MEPTIKRILIIVLLLLSAGCEPSGSPSNAYADHDLYPNFTAVEDETGEVTTTVVLEPNPFTGQMLYLAGGDKFYASLGTPTSQLLNMSSDLFSTSQTLSSRLKVMEWRSSSTYVAIDDTTGLTSPVRSYVSFQRGDGRVTGETWVELPPAFTLLNPAANSSISRTFQDPITLSWTDVDSTATMQLESQVVCLGIRYSPIIINLGSDTGSAQVSAADYFPPSAPINWDCLTAFTLKRLGPVRLISQELGLGTLNTFQGIQQRTVAFTTTP